MNYHETIDGSIIIRSESQWRLKKLFLPLTKGGDFILDTCQDETDPLIEYSFSGDADESDGTLSLWSDVVEILPQLAEKKSQIHLFLEDGETCCLTISPDGMAKKRLEKFFEAQ
jgi:hypothetical protein